MIFILAIFALVWLALAIVPAALLGLATAVLSRRQVLPIRILLVLVATAAAMGTWAALLQHSYLAPIAAALAGSAVLISGGITLLWSVVRRRTASIPAGAWPPYFGSAHQR